MASSIARTLEITIISGENLQIDGQPVKKKTYVIVMPDCSEKYSRSTEISERDHHVSFPSWNEKLLLDLPETARFMTVEVRCRNKIVGTARVPVSDFLSGYVPEGYLHFLSYRLRDRRGERNGIVNISVRVKNSALARGVVRQGCSSAMASFQSGQRSALGVPLTVADRRFGDRTVTGIPVWSARPAAMF